MSIPPEWLPVLIALLGGAGIGGLITAIVNWRSSVYKNMNDFIDQLQEARKEDRESMSSLHGKVDATLNELHVEREYSTSLYVWGMNGAPPPPPVRGVPNSGGMYAPTPPATHIKKVSETHITTTD